MAEGPFHPPPGDDRCFVCSPTHPQGLRLRFLRHAAHVEAHWTVQAGLEGWAGVAHGGLLAALHDDAAGWAMLLLERSFGVTTGLDVRYRAPVKVGDDLAIRGRVLRRDGKRVVLATEIVTQAGHGRAASTAEVTYHLLAGEEAARVLGRPLAPAFEAWLKDPTPAPPRP